MWVSYILIIAGLDYSKYEIVEGFYRKKQRSISNIIKHEKIPTCKKKILNEAVTTLKAAITISKDYLKELIIVVSLCKKKYMHLMSSVTKSIN